MKPDFKKYINDFDIEIHFNIKSVYICFRDYNDWTAMVDIINQFAEDYAEQENAELIEKYNDLYSKLENCEQKYVTLNNRYKKIQR